MLQDNTTPAAAVIDNIDDLMDLDDLLDESTKLAKAKKAKNQGKKLDKDLEELLESSKDAEDHRLWEPTGMLAHFIEETCQCGCGQRRFDDWFQIFTHRRFKEVHKMVRVTGPDEWAVESWTTVKAVDYCTGCLDVLGIVKAAPLEIFEVLGERELVEESKQLSLFDEMGLSREEVLEAFEECLEELDAEELELELEAEPEREETENEKP